MKPSAAAATVGQIRPGPSVLAGWSCSRSGGALLGTATRGALAEAMNRMRG